MVVDHDVFIVHADDDTPFVKGELLPMLGLSDDRVILSSELPFPAFTEQAIEDAVRRGRLTLAVLSPAYLRDHWAGFAELLSRNVRDDGRGGSLVPLLIADCDAPAILAQHEMLDCRSPQQRETSAARLRARLGRPDPLVEQIACPYPGMQPFSAATAAQFHGRAKEIDELLGRIQAGEREIYVIGPSGSGKSSLVAAGVIPRLQSADGSLGRHRFAVRTFRPGDHPMQRLAEALACDPSTLDGVAGRLLQAAGADRLLFLVDQFEELFALADAQERHQFVRALRVLRTDHRCHLIIALRADFYGALMSSELWPDIDGRFTRLEIAPLYGAALREAIELPTRNSGVYLERELVERLISDAAAEPGALPLLQEALVLLWGRRSHRLLRLTSYDELGSDGQSGLAVALARRADAVLHDFKPSQQRLFRRIFLRLVSFGEGRPDTRRQQPRAALSTSGEDAESVDKIIDQLIDERMLTSDATAHGEPLIDLSHEALIAGWPAFQGWLLTRRDDEQRRRLLELHVAEWVKRGRGSAGLFDAIELAEAERWIAGETAHELGYSDDLPRFLAASRAAIEEAERQKQLALEQQALERRTAQDERTRLRRRLARFAIVALTLFSIIASIIGLVAWRQRLEAERQRLEAQLQHQKAQLQLGRNEQEQARSLIVERNDPIGAIPHLLQAVNFGVDDPVLRTLLAEVKHGGVWRVAVRHGAPISTAAFSPDGTRIVTTGQDGAVRIWDAATGTPLGVPLKHEKKVRSASLSLDGSRLVSTDEGGAVRVWDASTGAPLGVPLKNKVRSAAFSPDGTRVVTVGGGGDGTARVWDVATRVPLGVTLNHGQPLTSAAFSPDGSRLVTASYDGTARVWNAATGAPLGVPLKHEREVAAFSPDGSRIVTAGEDGTARIWDVATRAPLGIPLKHEKAIRSATFSSDGSRVLTASEDGTARVWNAATGTPLGVPLKHKTGVYRATFSHDGSRVATVDYHETARVWDVATGTQLGVLLKYKNPVAVLSVGFSPRGTHVVTANDDGTARVWDAATGKPVGLPLKHEEAVRSAAFSPDGSRVVTTSADGTARVWDAATGNPVGLPLKHEKNIWSAAFSPDGSRVVTAGGDGTARVWDTATGTPVGLPLKHERAVDSAAFTSDGTRVVTTSNDGTACVWDAATGASLAVPLKYGRAVWSATFSQDGTRVVTISEDGTARVWDAATATQLGVTLKYEKNIGSAAFSPDGSRVVTTGEDGTARVWDAATGTALGVTLKHGQEARIAVFNPDGTHIVTAGSDGTAHAWDAATGAPLAVTLKHGQAIRSVAFSPDGTRVVTTGKDGTARIWNATTGTQLGVTLQHEPMVESAAFSPDGSRVVTAGGDGTARVWDATTGAPLGAPLKHEHDVMSAAFSPDGYRLLTASVDGTARLWNLVETRALSGWVEQARKCVTPRFDTADSVAICPLSAHETTPSELLARALSLTAAGDAAMFAHVSPLPRAQYQRAIELLDDNRDLVGRVNEHEGAELRRAVSLRLAVLDAVEGRLHNARVHFGADAPDTDALLLDKLGTFAHEELANEPVAVRLLIGARDLNPAHVSILTNLAEAYFAAGQYKDFARMADRLDKLQTTSDVRIAMAALGWATARLTRKLDGPQAARLLRIYQDIANDAHSTWSWNGTMHALKYSRFRFEEVEPILDVLALLKKMVTDETRVELAELLQSPKATRSGAK
jgi:WD40 repeat protein